MPDRPLYTNRLIKEKSPYLLQHAHNPVNWYPWGDEAFVAAREGDKPIFLSIGYATCHWCHVMEKESFEDVEVARLMNDVFINIKIDREELPEVDSLYMEFAQSMMAGAAGWPLNVILTPELQPFFAATYLPPHSSHGYMGLTELVQRIREVWRSEERERVELQASKIVEVFSDNVHVKGEEIPEKESIDDAAELLFKMADPVHGGMKGTPKFPIGYQSNFMLHYASKTKDSRALFLVERTLEMMHRGGIYDHLGGGFHRYSVDEQWFVPHFEKMLYDNALLVHAYLEAFQATKRKLYRDVAEEIFNYILRDMTHPQGGFYSAQDADSEGHEGYFYTWPFEEVQGLLGINESVFFCQYYNIISAGNFEGRNIPHVTSSIEEFARSKSMNEHDLSSLFKLQRQLLWKVRENRPHPFKDDKILCAWNGLAIYSFAWGGHILGEPKYVNAAENAARFIQENLWQDGMLMRRWREGEAQFAGGLDEYAFLIRGLIALFEVNKGVEWLEWALQLTEIVSENFKEKDGAYYQTNGQDPSIILRKSQFSDGAEPSGNAIQCENLLKLYQFTADKRYLNEAEDIFKAVDKYLENYPPGYCYHLLNLITYYDKKAPTIVIALNAKQSNKAEIEMIMNAHFIPHKAVVWRTGDNERLFKILPFIKEQGPINNQTTLYICHEGVCEKPLTNLDEMETAFAALE